MKALIIAAGKGNRLCRWDGDSPKPLHKVAGLSLIERAILSAKKAGITEFVIVTGYRGEEIQKKLKRREKQLGVTMEFVQNPDWEKANGHSVLCARPFLSQDFILLMSDHIFDWRILSKLLNQRSSEEGVVLAVDRRVGEIFDLEDATKVKVEGDAIVSIGKQLSDYNAIDTGIFYCSPHLFNSLEKSCAEGKGSLSEAIHFLALQGKARGADIGNHYWQDVDTPPSLKQAEKVLFQSLRKETDGTISRYFNRNVSGFITRWLVKTPLTANLVTWSALVIGLLSGFLVSRGTWWDVALGGIIFQFASIYDGCDGEMAKLKFSSSKFGEWLDTICDNITYVAFFIGVVVGVHRQGFTNLVPLGLMMVVGVTVTLLSMYLYLIRYTNSGSLVTVQKDLIRDLETIEQNFFIRFVTKVKFMMKRDFFALLFMVFCLFNKLDWVLILTAVGANLTWIVLLTMKREFVPAKVETELSE